MQLLVIVLNKVECLYALLEELGKNKIIGATILESSGMVHDLYQYDELRFFGQLRNRIDPARSESKTIMMVLDEAKVPIVSEIVNRVTGGLDRVDTGILFTVPVSHVEGLKKRT